MYCFLHLTFNIMTIGPLLPKLPKKIKWPTFSETRVAAVWSVQMIIRTRNCGIYFDSSDSSTRWSIVCSFQDWCTVRAAVRICGLLVWERERERERERDRQTDRKLPARTQHNGSDYWLTTYASVNMFFTTQKDVFGTDTCCARRRDVLSAERWALLLVICSKSKWFCCRCVTRRRAVMIPMNGLRRCRLYKWSLHHQSIWILVNPP